MQNAPAAVTFCKRNVTVLAFDHVPARKFGLLRKREVHSAHAATVRQRYENGEDAFLALRGVFLENFLGNILCDRFQVFLDFIDLGGTRRANLFVFFLIFLALFLHGDRLLAELFVFLRRSLDFARQL